MQTLYFCPKPNQMKKFLFTPVLFLLLIFQSHAQHDSSKVINKVNEVLSIISGEEGEARDWEQFEACFSPTAQIVVVAHDTLGHFKTMTFDVERFMSIGQKVYEKNYFSEVPIRTKVEIYNGLASVFQSYIANDGKHPEQRGINSYELVYTDGVWKIQSLIWSSNDNGAPLPERYVK